jgi:hypothetical protein
MIVFLLPLAAQIVEILQGELQPILQQASDRIAVPLRENLNLNRC